MDGCDIGNNSIVGAAAVVTKSIPEYSVAAGIPAKIIKSRK
jgi:acetyltransferase-like isoleucine patch superfamily enzyme